MYDVTHVGRNVFLRISHPHPKGAVLIVSQIFGPIYIRPHGMTNSKQPNFAWLSNYMEGKFSSLIMPLCHCHFLTRMLTRDLFAVANLLVYTCLQKRHCSEADECCRNECRHITQYVNLSTATRRNR